ncbi:nuclear mRNA export, poly(A)+RNA binding protein [Rhizoclosmatium hyalinum]|nr:nuclear mRNA export, poly(A)+RNA binding protein [Rhizoclosmatium hyalinum]
MDADAGVAIAGRFGVLANSAGNNNDTITGPNDMNGNQRSHQRRPANPYGVGRGRGSRFHQNMSLVRPTNGVTLANEVSVLNWKEKNNDPVSLFEFLKSKVTSTTISVVTHRFDGDLIIIKLRTPIEVNAVCDLSGIRYAGGKLIIKSLNAPGPATSTASQESETASITTQPGVLALITEILQSRYNQEGKFLDLANLPNDPRMQSNVSLSGFGSDSQETLKIGPVICKLVGKLFPDVMSINFHSCKLLSLKPFATLSVYCPFVQNLCFESNMLQAYRDVEALEGHRLKNLREVIFGGNPVYDREAKKGEPGITAYRTKMKQIFPTIKILDMVPFEDEIALPEIGLPSEDALPETEKGSFMDSEVTANMVQAFIPKFFGLFDSNRPALSDVYLDNSHFSVSVNPVLRRIRPGGPGHKGRETFDTWLSQSRNHVSCKDAGKRLSLLAKGPQAISNLFTKLPQTKHPINASFEKKMMAADAYQQQMGDGVVLVLTIQGDFSEVAIEKSKSFTRTFILVPAPPGSRASQNGWDVCILNDILVIRSWAPERVWENKPISQISSQPTNGPLIGLAHGARAHDGSAVAASGPSGGATGNGALPNDVNVLMQLKNAHALDDARHNLVIQFAQMTGLNYQFAAQCLNEVVWNGDAALAAFNNVRAQIPPAAFVFQPL